MIKPAKHIQSLEPYSLSERDLFDKEYIKLDWNETHLPINNKLRDHLISQIKEVKLNLYPKLINKELQIKLSNFTQVNSNCISVFPGSDVGLEYICRSYLEKGDFAYSIGPTYDNFRIFVASTGANHNIIYPDTIENYSLKKQIAKIEGLAKIVYFTNPNNPTSYFTEEIEIKECLDSHKDTLFICDEAYFEFSNISMTNLIKENDNIIFSRSFSKGLGLAGLRIGYLLSNPGILENINKIKNFKNLTSLSQSSAIFMLENLDILEERLKDVEISRNIIIDFLSKKNIVFFSGNTNFVLIDTKKNPKLKDIILKNRFIFREFNTNFLQGYIRLTYPQSSLATKFCKIIDEGL